MTKRNATRLGGLTMVEMMIVIAVLGILLTIGGLFLNGVLRQQRLNEAARTLGETLRRVSDLALNGSQGYTLMHDSTTLEWYESVNVGASKGSQTLPHNVVIDKVTPSGNIEFSGRGLPVNGVLFTISLGANTRNVYLFPTGAISYP